MRLFRTCLRAGAVVAFALAVPAAVAGAPAGAPSAAPRDANNVRGISEAMEAIASGAAKYEAKDYPGAVELFRKATKLAPRNALAFYCLGAAQLASGSAGEAEVSFKKADEVGDATPNVKAKALFALADLAERAKKWDDAKAAWQRYTEYANKHDAGAFPQTGTSRVTAIDDMLKQDKAYEIVRQRIAAEKAGDAGAANGTK